MKKITFIIHGKHLRKHKIEYEAGKFLGKEFDPAFFITKSSRAAEELAEKTVRIGTDYLIAVGGDGTMSEVVNGIMRVPKSERENLIVGLLPVGSGNDFARSLKLSSEIQNLHELIRNNKIIQLDIGKLEYKSLANEDKVHFFDNITDVGLGAEVAKRVNEGNKTYGPNLAFFTATITSFLCYKRKKIKITSREFNYEGNVLILALANARYFGSGICIAPHAKVNDGRIAVTLAGNVSLLDYLKNLSKIRKGEFVNLAEMHYKEVGNCIVEPIGEPCLIEADGEMIGKIPLKVSMLQKEIKFLSEITE
ncbi:MAG: hypothetical protein M1391_00595 [Bacteroidetes bacterium]|nr:hypothetical protein [Bacteroidota bacterium]